MPICTYLHTCVHTGLGVAVLGFNTWRRHSSPRGAHRLKEKTNHRNDCAAALEWKGTRWVIEKGGHRTATALQKASWRHRVRGKVDLPGLITALGSPQGVEWFWQWPYKFPVAGAKLCVWERWQGWGWLSQSLGFLLVTVVLRQASDKMRFVP